MRRETSWEEKSLITALRPFAIIAAHMPAEALEKIGRRRSLRADMQAVAGLLSDDTDKII